MNRLSFPSRDPFCSRRKIRIKAIRILSVTEEWIPQTKIRLDNDCSILHCAQSNFKKQMRRIKTYLVKKNILN